MFCVAPWKAPVSLTLRVGGELPLGANKILNTGHRPAPSWTGRIYDIIFREGFGLGLGTFEPYQFFKPSLRQGAGRSELERAAVQGCVLQIGVRRLLTARNTHPYNRRLWMQALPKYRSSILMACLVRIVPSGGESSSSFASTSPLRNPSLQIPAGTQLRAHTLSTHKAARSYFERTASVCTITTA